jgi:hypothetical protein
LNSGKQEYETVTSQLKQSSILWNILLKVMSQAHQLKFIVLRSYVSSVRERQRNCRLFRKPCHISWHTSMWRKPWTTGWG